MEEFRRATGYEDLAYSIMGQEPELAMLRAENVKVICVVSDAAEKDRNGLKVYAKTEKIPPKYKLLTDADVMITIYENNIMFFF
jgi:ribosomal protein L30E